MKDIYLHDLLKTVNIKFSSRLVNALIRDITFNSKEAGRGSLFLGLPGKKVDGGNYWKEAIKNGAEAAIISKEAEKITGDINSQKVLALTEPLDNIFGQIISEFWDKPSNKLKLIGVTGTNGKTTISFLLEHLLKKLGKKTALFGTIINRWPGFSEISEHTTDFADKLQHKLNSAFEKNAEFAVMEVSSHAIAQKRIAGCEFLSVIFTNLSQDHLDYHHDMKSYFRTKMELFKSPYLCKKDSFAVVNIDDNWGRELLKNLGSNSLKISARKYRDNMDFDKSFFVSDKKLSSNGSKFLLHSPTETREFFIPMVGEFNLMNSIQVIGLLNELGFSLKRISDAIKTFPGVPGRMEKIMIDQNIQNYPLPTVFVDYAHTPDGLRNVLETIRNFSKARIITVFGCGGDRDTGKRPLMGSIVEELSDLNFITSDNPRTENPKKIINDIFKGIKQKERFKIEIDRRVAIKKAIENASGKDIILIAGKGHEDYQIIGNKKIEFDDRAIANQYLLDKINKIT